MSSKVVWKEPFSRYLGKYEKFPNLKRQSSIQRLSSQRLGLVGSTVKGRTKCEAEFCCNNPPHTEIVPLHTLSSKVLSIKSLKLSEGLSFPNSTDGEI